MAALEMISQKFKIIFSCVLKHLIPFKNMLSRKKRFLNTIQTLRAYLTTVFKFFLIFFIFCDKKIIIVKNYVSFFVLEKTNMLYFQVALHLPSKNVSKYM